MTLLALLLTLFLQPATGSVEGNVVRSDTKAPVAAARVMLVRPDGPLAGSMVGVSNARGDFSITGVASGTYRVFVEHENYLRTESTPISVAAGQAQNISATLSPLGVITGRVATPLGDPAPAVYVRALTKTGVAAEVRTDDRGEYRLFALAPGSYVVVAERYMGPRIEAETALTRGATYTVPGPPCPFCLGEGRGMMPLTRILSTGEFLDPLALTGQTYPAVFYPGTLDRATARPLEIRAGTELAGIDFQLVIREP